MDEDIFYSIRMRASAGDRHISGAERIVPPIQMDAVVQALFARAREKQIPPEQIIITIDDLGSGPIRTLNALDVVTLNTLDASSGRSAASRVLQSLGISERSSVTALELLGNGAASDGNSMRGAIVMDAVTGERLEPDRERGVRASRFDWTDEAREVIIEKLEAIGLRHFRTREALALATKVAHAPGMIAELCWSDEPDYTAGYVASRSIGYVRFPILKSRGETTGGRVFFVDRNGLDMNVFLRYLQLEPVLIIDGGTFRHPVEPERYFKE
jgi:6-carboxyhexanoate--CoA ligase